MPAAPKGRQLGLVRLLEKTEFCAVASKEKHEWSLPGFPYFKTGRFAGENRDTSPSPAGFSTSGRIGTGETSVEAPLDGVVLARPGGVNGGATPALAFRLVDR